LLLRNDFTHEIRSRRLDKLAVEIETLFQRPLNFVSKIGAGWRADDNFPFLLGRADHAFPLRIRISPEGPIGDTQEYTYDKKNRFVSAII